MPKILSPSDFEKTNALEEEILLTFHPPSIAFFQDKLNIKGAKAHTLGSWGKITVRCWA